ncbi:E3 ubiquitin-protein ligase Rnf220-like isoform X2 [Gigantopelta aegis]|nr:E3 ubiquitin-protein ligase Rnf220-like isoform X2 [Gigantopelta aegis]XP_041358422.1 E3 ubiquitin-protein ligase Rnf220-like isoform X2 [Gigantopelta aegis]
MENTSFVPNPLTSPALMVLASTAEGHESGRLPAPHNYHGQGMDKEMPTPFSTPFSMHRLAESFQQPMYAPIPPYVRPTLDRGMGLISPGGGGAFRPLVSTADGSDSYQSAFTPAKKSKIDNHISSSSDHTANSDSRSRESPEGPLSFVVKEERPSSISSTGADTNSENHSDSGDLYDRGTPDSEGRSLRKQRKRNVLDGQTPCCPVCGLTLRSGEIEAHLSLELEKLEKLSRSGRKSRDTTPQGRKSLPSPGFTGRKGKDSPSPEVASQSRYESYMRIRCNRQARLSSRCRNKKKKPNEEGYKETSCPVCNDRLTGSSEELNHHVEECLRKHRGECEDEPVDVEGDGEQYEEYTWAGQTRIRATTMLEGGFAGSGFHTVSSRKTVDEEDDLNVDGDDSELYGGPQYTEANVVPVASDEPSEDRERQALRGAVIGSRNNGSDGDWSHHYEDNAPPPKNNCDVLDSNSLPHGSAAEVITALKARLREKEDTKDVKQKCLICMEPYKNALTSIQCWHVHCEECWLRTLGAKKLCPQCNTITSPSDLRRIYL